MDRTRVYAAWFLAFAMFFLASFLLDTSPANTAPEETLATAAEETAPTSPESPSSEEAVSATTAAIKKYIAPKPVTKQGLLNENGFLYYYKESGALFTDGILELEGDHYFFLSNGRAFNTGYKAVEIDGTPCYYFFESSGKAFTGGLKDITFGTETYTYFFGEDGKAVTSGWATQNGAHYYFRADGRAVKDGFVLIDQNRYHFDEEGRVTIGWFCIDECYYYAGETGVLATDTIVDNYRLDKNGRSHTKYQILQYVNELTDPSMTDQEKIDALYDWLTIGHIYYYNSYEHIQAGWYWPDGWIDVFAADMMENQYGNCFKYAAFLGLMIREATDLPVAIYHGKLPMGDPHGWVTVYQEGAWYVYDVQQAIQGEDPAVCYKAPYPLERLTNGVGTLLD